MALCTSSCRSLDTQGTTGHPARLQNTVTPEGKFLGSPGHLRVTVSPDRTTADYVASNRSVAYSYSIQAGNKP